MKLSLWALGDMLGRMTYLDKILESHRSWAKSDDRSLDKLLAARNPDRPVRQFRKALQVAAGVAVISEVKRRSPSKGDLAPNLDAASLAKQYEAGGASCISVLTDADFFAGSVEDLQQARAAVSLPVLRKDFIVSANGVVDTFNMGADAVLLICAALDDVELKDFHDLAKELGLDALVEIHDEAEAERALSIGAELIGINQRDLVTFEVDTGRAKRVAESLPRSACKVAESGITGPEVISDLAGAGFKAVLVGESLVLSEDPKDAVRDLRAASI